ncbi:hypothetical protein [Streptomyces sp. NPDC049585]|uniref:hypothetical protein n=1 Tax=Streptomyces sp. NPDC049585 TaxID=3155154 RepID=UPI00341232C2
MPRGRHRHSAPLHRLLPPLSVAATSVACAAGALVVGEPLVIRALAAASAAAAVVGSVMMRRWDRAAGKRVAQLSAARTRDEWKTEERIAELETDLEETRLARTRVEVKLRNKRAELARLRTEHADLLRRYATAETERASALEGRRLLEKGAGAKPAAAGEAKALPPAGIGPDAYRRAADALRTLERKAEATAAAKTAEKASAKAAEKAAAQDAVKDAAKKQKPAAKKIAKADAAPPVPAARRKVARTQGGFDFFGNAKKDKPVDEQDLADVVGEEALAEAAGVDEDGKVIDLTAHDETEQIDVAELRTAIS